MTPVGTGVARAADGTAVPYPCLIAASAAARARLLLALACLVLAVVMAADRRQENRLAQAEDALTAGRSADAARIAASASGRAVEARAARVQAEAALQMGDLVAAERHVARAAAAAPNDWSLHRDRAVLLQRLGRSAEARPEMARALALNPRLPIPPGFRAPRRSSAR